MREGGVALLGWELVIDRQLPVAELWWRFSRLGFLLGVLIGLLVVVLGSFLEHFRQLMLAVEQVSHGLTVPLMRQVLRRVEVLCSEVVPSMINGPKPRQHCLAELDRPFGQPVL